VCVEKIYNSMPINNSFFLKKDLDNIIKQNNGLEKFNIPKNITKKFKTVEYSKKIAVANEYIQFSIPIFSKDNKKAYLEYDKHTGNENSYGKSLYLEKINGKWKIKFWEKLWAN
jgi:hypothetical protein